MKRISSGMTVFYKRVLPVAWFGFVLLFLFGTPIATEASGFLFVAVPFIGITGYVYYRNLVIDLADEVYDCGDHLLVRSKGQEHRIALSEIINVNSTMMVNPSRITLRLAEAGPLGSEIAFSPVREFTMNPFAKSRIAEDLIVRTSRTRHLETAE